MTKVTPQIEDRFEQVKEPEHVVLEHIHDGVDDVRQLNKETALTRRQINYRFTKLAGLGLITVDKPDSDEYVTEVINGDKHTYKAPKSACLTPLGETYLDWAEAEGVTDKYDGMTVDEVAQLAQENAARIEAVETQLEQFRRQVLSRLDD